MSRYLFFLALLTETLLSASFPVAHLVVAEMWAVEREQYNDEQRRDLLIGTLFPDIRYMGEVHRHDTHPENVTVEQITAAEHPFEKGVLLHAFLDQERSKYVEARNSHNEMKRLLPTLLDQDLDTFLKLLEDSVLYRTQTWMRAQRYLVTILPQENDMGASVGTAMRWHMYLSRYLSEGPERLLWQLSFLGRGFFGRPVSLVSHWCEQLTTAKELPEVQEHVNGLLSHIHHEFRNNR